MLTVVFLATVDWEDVEDAGTYETGFAWLTGTDREGSTAGQQGGKIPDHDLHQVKKLEGDDPNQRGNQIQTQRKGQDDQCPLSQ